MNDLNHETFDIRDVLTGRTFPEDTCTVHLDAKADFEISKLNEELSNLRFKRKPGDDTSVIDELEAKIAKLTGAAVTAGTTITVTVRAIPLELRNTMRDEVTKQYPEERNVLGYVETVPARDVLWTNRLWQAHIISLESSRGKDTDISYEKVVAIRASVPEYGLQKIADTIDGLYQGAAKGYEQAAQATDFSSAVSLGA